MKRVVGSRILGERVIVPKKLLNEILLEVKSFQNINWNNFAKILNVNVSTLRHDWRKKCIALPLKHFKLILDFHPSLHFKDLEKYLIVLDSSWGQRLGKKSKHDYIIKIPKIDQDFAEFYGILAGDGCVYNDLSGFCISGNSILDKNYIEIYVSNLIYKLFKIKPRIYYSKTQKSIRGIVYSKQIAEFLVNFGFPRGYKKKGKLVVPQSWFKKQKLLTRFIRGLNDTDGSVYPQKNSKIVLDMSITQKSLLESSIKAFNILNFKINNTTNRIYLCGHSPVSNFFSRFGSSNFRNIIKYKTYLQKGQVPTTIQTERLLKQMKIIKVKLPYYGPMV